MGWINSSLVCLDVFHTLECMICDVCNRWGAWRLVSAGLPLNGLGKKMQKIQIRAYCPLFDPLVALCDPSDWEHALVN